MRSGTFSTSVLSTASSGKPTVRCLDRTPTMRKPPTIIVGAIDAVEFLPAAKKNCGADLTYRGVIALALDSLATRPASPGAVPREPLDSFRLAEHLMRRTPQGKADSSASMRNKFVALPSVFLPAKALHSPSARKELNAEKLAAVLAQTCLKYAKAKRSSPVPSAPPSPGAAASDLMDKDLRYTIYYMSKRPRHYDRDELERLMFRAPLGAPAKRPRLETGGPAFLGGLVGSPLHRVAGTARSQVSADRLGLLRYLRPYFNVAFLAKAEIEPGQVKELIELMHLATTGRPYDKFRVTAKHPGSESSPGEGLPFWRFTTPPDGATSSSTRQVRLPRWLLWTALWRTSR